MVAKPIESISTFGLLSNLTVLWIAHAVFIDLERGNRCVNDLTTSWEFLEYLGHFIGAIFWGDRDEMGAMQLSCRDTTCERYSVTPR